MAEAKAGESTSKVQEDPAKVAEDVVSNLKSRGLFDQFRKECLEELENMESYRLLKQRVENHVASFLSKFQWSEKMSKNSVRDSLRTNINRSEVLLNGIDRLIDQILSAKTESFANRIGPEVDKHLGIDKQKLAEGSVIIELSSGATEMSPSSAVTQGGRPGLPSSASQVAQVHHQSNEPSFSNSSVQSRQSIIQTTGSVLSSKTSNEIQSKTNAAKIKLQSNADKIVTPELSTIVPLKQPEVTKNVESDKQKIPCDEPTVKNKGTSKIPDVSCTVNPVKVDEDCNLNPSKTPDNLSKETVYHQETAADESSDTSPVLSTTCSDIMPRDSQNNGSLTKAPGLEQGNECTISSNSKPIEVAETVAIDKIHEPGGHPLSIKVDDMNSRKENLTKMHGGSEGNSNANSMLIGKSHEEDSTFAKDLEADAVKDEELVDQTAAEPDQHRPDEKGEKEKINTSELQLVESLSMTAESQLKDDTQTDKSVEEQKQGEGEDSLQGQNVDSRLDKDKSSGAVVTPAIAANSGELFSHSIENVSELEVEEVSDASDDKIHSCDSQCIVNNEPPDGSSVPESSQPDTTALGEGPCAISVHPEIVADAENKQIDRNEERQGLISSSDCDLILRHDEMQLHDKADSTLVGSGSESVTDLEMSSDSSLGVGLRTIRRRKRLISETDDEISKSKSARVVPCEQSEGSGASMYVKGKPEEQPAEEVKIKRGRGRPRKTAVTNVDEISKSATEAHSEGSIVSDTADCKRGRSKTKKQDELSFYKGDFNRQTSVDNESSASDSIAETKEKDARRTRRQIKPKRCYSPSDGK